MNACYEEGKMKKVFDCGGECLGNKWVDLSGLQETTRHAILQMIYLDETVGVLTSAGQSKHESGSDD